MRENYVIGIDFGTDSARAVVIDIKNGHTLGTAISEYKRWSKLEYCNPNKDMFRQHPLDYIEAMESCVKKAIKATGKGVGDYIRGIAVDTTGSTPTPVNKEGIPLALLPEFVENPNAMFYLWKDHTAIGEAKEINEVFSNFGGEDYTRFQGTYASEWYWAKILHASRVDSRVKEEAYSWVEHSDWIPAILTGNTDPKTMYRCSCAAGHKALWHSDFNGLPALDCLEHIDPYLADVARHYGNGPQTSTYKVGTITNEWARRLGINSDVIVGGSSFDAHAGAVGVGIQPNILVKVVGTSTVDMLVHKRESLRGKDLKGICGQAENSILPGYVGLESSQAAFGDIYSWFRNILMWSIENIAVGYIEKGKRNNFIAECKDKMLDCISEEALKIDDFENLTVIDWFNGRRYPFINEHVKGGMYGLTIGTNPVQLFRAMVLSAVFGSRRIFDSFITRGIQINEVITVGGIPKKSPLVMQMMADVLKRPIKIAKTDQACAQGAAMYAAVASGFYHDLLEAQQHMCLGFEKTYKPNEKNFAKYDKLYGQYLNVGKHFEEIQNGRDESQIKEV